MFDKLLPSIRKKPETSLAPASNVWEMFDQMEKMLQEYWPKELNWNTSYPAVEVIEKPEEIVVKAELPGIDVKDVEVRLENNQLVIQGEKKRESKEEKDNILRMEVSYGSFYRVIPLPAEVKEDKIKAKYKKGVLTITLPKSEQAKAKKISIES